MELLVGQMGIRCTMKVTKICLPGISIATTKLVFDLSIQLNAFNLVGNSGVYQVCERWITLQAVAPEPSPKTLKCTICCCPSLFLHYEPMPLKRSNGVILVDWLTPILSQKEAEKLMVIGFELHDKLRLIVH